MAICIVCETKSEKTFSCTRCYKAVYCGKKCQLQHWPKHKPVCNNNRVVGTVTVKEEKPPQPKVPEKPRGPPPYWSNLNGDVSTHNEFLTARIALANSIIFKQAQAYKLREENDVKYQKYRCNIPLRDAKTIKKMEPLLIPEWFKATTNGLKYANQNSRAIATPPRLIEAAKRLQIIVRSLRGRVGIQESNCPVIEYAETKQLQEVGKRYLRRMIAADRDGGSFSSLAIDAVGGTGSHCIYWPMHRMTQSIWPREIIPEPTWGGSKAYGRSSIRSVPKGWNPVYEIEANIVVDGHSFLAYEIEWDNAHVCPFRILNVRDPTLLHQMEQSVHSHYHGYIHGSRTWVITNLDLRETIVLPSLSVHCIFDHHFFPTSSLHGIDPVAFFRVLACK